MQSRHDALLSGSIKVYQRIAANQEFHVRDGGIKGEVALAKNHQAAHIAVHPHDLIAGEVFCAQLRGDPAQQLGCILGAARGIQRVIVNISGVDFYVIIRKLGAKVFSNDDGRRVSLFAAGAARAPHPQRVAGAQAAA